MSGALHPGSIGIAAVRLYKLGFLLSTTLSALLYYTSCRIWPVQIYPPELQPKDESWEAMRYSEGFFPEDEVIPDYLRRSVLEGEQLHVVATVKDAGLLSEPGDTKLSTIQV